MRPNRNNMIDYLIDYQLKLVGLSIDDVLIMDSEDDSWRKNKITYSQYIEFRKHAIPIMQKVYKFNRKKAESNFEWFFNEFGLTIKKENIWISLLNKIGNMNFKKITSFIWKTKKD
jgi:hypothetical protein